MKAPLAVLVTALTYDVVVAVTYVDRNGRVARLHQDRENTIDCGKVGFLYRAAFRNLKSNREKRRARIYLGIR